MNAKNFLLGFLGTPQTASIKGKNPNSSSKLIKSKPSTIKPAQQKPPSQKQLPSKDKKSSALKQIQKLQKQLQSATQNIEQTEKKLDTDLFLKKQKQKRLQYAKNLNQQYEIQKKKRQEMLYKKYRCGDKNQEQTESGLEQVKNIKTGVPLELIKILELQNTSISKSKSILNGHHYTTEMLSDDKMMTYEEIAKEERQLLFGQPNQENAEITTNNDENSLKCTLMPLKKIAENMLNIHYFPIDFSKPLLEPTQQYQTLMSALTLLPQHLSNKYFQIKQINNYPYFLCKFFLNGHKKTVITTDLIETRSFAHYHINLHSKMADNRSFGPTIVEKCFRKVSANLEYPELNCAIFALFGVDPEIIGISNRNYLKENFQMVLKWMMASGQVVGFMNDNGHNLGIYENRMYRLRGVVEAVELTQEQLEQTRKKKGKTSKDSKDESIIPTNQVSHKTLFHLQNPYKGTLLDPKNLNKFSLLQLFQKFNKLILIRDYPKTFTCKRINLQIFSLGPLSMTNNEWTKNNQYHFTVAAPVSLRIVMRNVHLSNAEAMVKREVKREEDYETNNLYGFMVFVCREGEEKVTCMKLDSLICKTKSNDSLQWPSYCEKFEKGSYIIIPYCNKVSKTTFQLFNLDFFIEKSQSLQFGKAIINEWEWVKQPNSGHNQKVIQSLENREYIQKTKIQDIQIPRIAPSGMNPDKLLESMIDKEKLFVTKGCSVKDLLIPGKINKFLINPDIQVQKKPNKTSKSNKNTQKAKNRQPLTKNQQIESLQKQQSLQILLGYDLLQGQDINRGLMAQFLQINEQVLDFQHYGLGSDGLTAIMETLMQCPSIQKLNLGYNELDDSAIVFLCYYLDKANRVELQELDLRGNNFGKIGLDAIKGVMARYTKLNVLY